MPALSRALAFCGSELRQLVHPIEEAEYLIGFDLIDHLEREADVNDHVLPWVGFGRMGQADALEYAPEVDSPHEHIVFLVRFDDFPRDSETHAARSVQWEDSPISIPLAGADLAPLGKPHAYGTDTTSGCLW